MNLTAVVAFGVGAILVYAAIKNKDPRDVVREALGQNKGKGTFGSPQTGGGGSF